MADEELPRVDVEQETQLRVKEKGRLDFFKKLVVGENYSYV